MGFNNKLNESFRNIAFWQVLQQYCYFLNREKHQLIEFEELSILSVISKSEYWVQIFKITEGGCFPALYICANRIFEFKNSRSEDGTDTTKGLTRIKPVLFY